MAKSKKSAPKLAAVKPVKANGAQGKGKKRAK
jgi:hypothetical protein